MTRRRGIAAWFAGFALAMAACTFTLGTPPPPTPEPAPSPVPTGPGSAAAAMETLCEAPKSGSGSGVTPEGPTPPAIETVEEQVETVRGLKYTSHVAVTPLTQEQIDRRLTKNFDKTYPVDFYARRSEAWATIGVIPAGASIRTRSLRSRPVRSWASTSRPTGSSSPPATPTSIRPNGSSWRTS